MNGDIGSRGPIGILSNYSYLSHIPTSYYIFMCQDEQENLVKIDDPCWCTGYYISRKFYLSEDAIKPHNSS